MAQNTGAERLLARPARLASARVLLALAAIAALALAGCGGGGSSGEQAASTPASSSQQGSAAKGTATTSSPGAKAGSQPVSPNSARQAGSSGPAGSQGQGARHGPKVQLPAGEPEPTATPAEEAQATVADIALRSPGLSAQGSLPAANTCDGADTWPTLEWQGIPAGTKELVLFAMNAAPVGGKLFFDWALAGVDPAPGIINSAKLPKGAVVGQNSFGKAGYSICPPQGGAETYVFALYAVPGALSPKPGFDPAGLRQRVQAVSRRVGLLAATYAR